MTPSTPASPGRRERKRLQTLEHLARTAAALFEAHGYEAVTMEQIAAAADVAKGTLYNHFAVKEAVLAHWLHLELGENLAALHARLESTPGFAAGARLVLDHSAGWCEAHPDYLAPYLRFRFAGIGATPSPSHDSEQLSDIADTFAWLVRRAQKQGELRDDLDPARLALSFHHLYLGAMLRWLAEPRLKLRKEFAAAVDLFLRGAAHPAQSAPKAARKALPGAAPKARKKIT
ncbi:helix-turn-helix domain-containing protein [Paraburkholderia sp. J76]|uniref:TetR/AcrR family transcriptional regulator n=1 Tax=Paraburkholderia sp. J76 TaxID=2805439 RepID=UPI002ABDBA71|nr:helix-turn-helix domain-containing protein [Paraburkholderia sp. J76]